MTKLPVGSRPGSAVPPRRRLPAVVRSRRDLEGTIARRVNRGELERVRRGVYRPTTVLASSDGAAVRRERKVLARIAAEHRARTCEFWFSHTSAALLWGCWTWQLADEVHTVQTAPPDVPRFDRSVRRHWTKDLRPGDTVLLDGVPVTSLARTAVDCARLLPGAEAVVVVDSALRLGVDPGDLDAALRAASGKRGVRSARRVLDLADGVVESPGESLARWVVADAGLAVPEAAIEVETWCGKRWVDLGWSDVKVGLEFDGALKYGGERGASALMEEKRRHDALVEAGWVLIRVTWDDLRNPHLLVSRFRAALARR